MYKKGQHSPKISHKAHVSLDHHEYIQRFSEAVQSYTGARPEIIADGKIHRFDDPEGKPNNFACWFVMHLCKTPFGAIGNWRTGQYLPWTGLAQNELSLMQRIELHEAIEYERMERRLRQEADWDEAAHKAFCRWNTSIPAKADHPYLLKKGVPPINLRTRFGALLAPIVDIYAQIWNVQSIFPDGSKRFLKGGRISGLFSLIGQDRLPTSGRLYICEGIATALTLHVETQVPVAAAMSCGNLKPVAIAISRAQPDLELIIAADNDHRTHGNPGMTKATDAARRVHCGIVWPRSCGESCSCTDFNDVAGCVNREVAA